MNSKIFKQTLKVAIILVTIFLFFVIATYNATLIIVKNNFGKELTDISLTYKNNIYWSGRLGLGESKILYLRDHDENGFKFRYCDKGSCFVEDVGYFIPGSLFSGYYKIEVNGNLETKLRKIRFGW